MSQETHSKLSAAEPPIVVQRSRHTLPECPNCRASLIRGKAQRQRINKLMVQCSHCQWKGTVADVDTHNTLEHPEADLAEALATDVVDDRNRTTAHACSHEWSFATDAEEDDPIEDESEPLIELKLLATADDPLKEENDGSLRDESPDPNLSTNCFSLHCTAQYTTKIAKWQVHWCSIIH